MIRRVLIIFLAAASPAFASFEEAQLGGRAVAFDGAVTAAPQDAFGAASNPAGAAMLTAPEAALDHGELYPGLSDDTNLTRSFGAYIHPVGRSAVGAGYETYRLNGLYKEEALGLMGAHRVTDRLSLGVGIRYLRKTIGSDEFTESAINPANGVGFGTSDPIFNGGRSASAITGDLGALFRFSDHWTIGASVKNVNEPDVALGGSEDRVARVTRAGVARIDRRWTVSAEAERGEFTKMENRFHVGAETWVTSALALRVGGGMGPRDYRRLSAGLGVRIGIVQLDYGIQLPLGTIEGTNGMHQVSLLLHFGQRPVPPPAPRTVHVSEHRPPSYVLPVAQTKPTQEENRTPPNAPALLDLLSVSNTKVGATWRPEPLASRYTLAVARTADLPRRPLATATFRDTSIGSIGNLAPETGYHLFLNACNGAGCSPWTALGVVYTRTNDLPKGDRFSFEANVRLTFNPGTLQATHNGEELRRFLKYLIERPNSKIVIEAHTDATGDEIDNVMASHRYAEEARRYLVERHGFSADSVSCLGYGSSRPVSDNLTDEGRAANQRVDFMVTTQEPPLFTDPTLQVKHEDSPFHHAPFLR